MQLLEGTLGVVHHGPLLLLAGVERVLEWVLGAGVEVWRRLGQVLAVVRVLRVHGRVRQRRVVVGELRVGGTVHQASHSYLHPKLDLLGREGVPLLEREWLAQAGPVHEGAGVGVPPPVRGQAPHALGREVGSGGLPLEQAQGAGALAEAGLAEGRVTLAGHLLVVAAVVAVHGGGRVLVVEHVLAGEPRFANEEGLPVLEGWRGLVSPGLHVMGGPLGLAKITRHVLLEVPRSREPLRTHSRSGLALSRRHQGHLCRR